MIVQPPFEIHIFPREAWSWKRFCEEAPECSIALDGMVRGGPNFDPATRRINFDHHEGVVREATMSTAKQVFFAIKGGLMDMMKGETVHIFINDTDQDTALAVWLLLHYKLFEGTQGIPHVHRLLELDDRLDVTGGAFPMNLDDRLVRQHTWVFEDYTRLRKSGALHTASAEILESNLQAVMSRLNLFMMNQGGEAELDTRREILYTHPIFMIVDEIGGNEARYYLFSLGMKAFVSLVTKRPDGRTAYSIGRRSRYIPFPVPEFYQDLNQLEGLSAQEGWGGSDIVGGSSRIHASSLTWEEIRDIILKRLGS